MIRWLASTQIIIVHGRQIIVNQGHGMNHFQRDGRRHALIQDFGLVGGEHFVGRNAENRTNALAAGHEGIHHTLHNFVRLGFFGNYRFGKSFFYEG